jgi:hypothetical protein
VKEMRDRRVVPWASLRVAVVTISLFVFLNISGHWEPGSKLKKTKSRQKSGQPQANSNLGCGGTTPTRDLKKQNLNLMIWDLGIKILNFS